MAVRISPAQARRVALASQGFARSGAPGRIDVRHFRRTLSDVGVVQLDSVNVVARAHYLPFFARLGPYPREALDSWLWGSGEVFEYWAHEASLVPVEWWPLFRHRMTGGWHWESVERLGREHPGYVDAVYEEVRERGPLAAGEVDDLPAPAGTWWDWSRSKLALEYLFLTGRVTVSHRRHFTRVYDLVERALDSRVLSSDAPEKRDAQKQLLRMAARRHGVGTVGDLADYFRIPKSEARPLLAELSSAGELDEVEIEGWKGPVFAWPGISIPRRIEATALLAPFDPVVWNRDRISRLFGFDYRIEIYVPRHKRVFGYYVLPFLCGDRLVARVDLKADRATGELLVRGAFGEDGIEPNRIGHLLAVELERMADWLELSKVRVTGRGNLAQAIVF